LLKNEKRRKGEKMGVGIPRMLRQRGMIALLEDIVVSVVPFLSLKTVHAILFVYV
jgi:hypothetical protein